MLKARLGHENVGAKLASWIGALGPSVQEVLQRRRYRWTALVGVLMVVAFLAYDHLVHSFSLPVAQSQLHLAYTPQEARALFDKVFPSASDAHLHLHFLMPATSSNVNLCKSLLSATANGFPAPVLINWNAKEDPDPWMQHLRKIDGILEYLQRLPDDQGSDLVLIVDGYDVLYQLPPEVLVSRYYDILEVENLRLRERFGTQAILDQHDISQTIVFGPEKECWPADLDTAACWAMPESSLPRYAHGPDTDTGVWWDNNRARWLNSGTILGPVRDIMKLYAATQARVRLDTEKTIISDQWYMQNIMGEQEYARRLILGDLPSRAEGEQWRWRDFDPINIPIGDWKMREPILNPGQEYEFHITLDYESRLFQTTAYSWKYLGLFAYDDSAWAGQLYTSKSSNDTIQARQTHFALSEDILSAAPPFSGLSNDVQPSLKIPDPFPDGRPTGLSLPTEPISWRDMLLGTNTASGHVFPMIHFTATKWFLQTWWNKLWFFPYGEAIIRNVGPAVSRPFFKAKDGRTWWTLESGDTSKVASGTSGGGAWDDRQALDGGPSWHGWAELCGAHERLLFSNELRQP